MESMSAGGGESFLSHFVPLQLASGDRFIDTSEVLKDDPAGAQIEMADFGIAHLTIGKSDIGAARAQFAPGIISIKLIVKWSSGEERGVAVFLSLGLAAGIDTPAVANDQHYRAGHARTVTTNGSHRKRARRTELRDGSGKPGVGERGASASGFLRMRNCDRHRQPLQQGKMKWRNQLLALLCLAVFAGLGVLYFKHWVVQKPFGIILIIGEGLAPERIALTRVYVGGADAHLALDGMPHVALVKNHANDFAVSDQAAAASALATGTKVNNRAISVDPNGKPLSSILELARKSGRATGLVTNGSITNATCAAFYAHAS